MFWWKERDILQIYKISHSYHQNIHFNFTPTWTSTVPITGNNPRNNSVWTWKSCDVCVPKSCDVCSHISMRVTAVNWNVRKSNKFDWWQFISDWQLMIIRRIIPSPFRYFSALKVEFPTNMNNQYNVYCIYRCNTIFIVQKEIFIVQTKIIFEKSPK